MNTRLFWWAVRIMVGVVLAVGMGASAQDPPPPPPAHFSGLINDYTPQTDLKTGTALGGPWELRGQWSLDLLGDSGKANFSAALNMTHDDYWVTENGAVNDDSSTGRNPHTHHIVMKNATVSAITNGFEVSGTITLISGNGNGYPKPLPFDCSTAVCTLTVDITGGTLVKYSNMTMTFGGPPTGHFGSQAIHGFVRFPKRGEWGDRDQN
jgi:hypothetical protein